MAENKKSFLLYCDTIHTVEKLSDEKAGQLLKHILKYVNDLNPETDDLIIQLAFEPIKQQLKRDLKKYEVVCDRNKINGLKGGRPKNPKKPKKPSGLFGNPEKPKKPDSDTDNDTDIDNDIKEEKTWRNDFETYRKNCSDGFVAAADDKEWVKKQERYNPDVDIVLSMEAAFDNYWGTEAGWKNKKKSKSDTLDWKQTIARTIKINRVFKKK